MIKHRNVSKKRYGTEEENISPSTAAHHHADATTVKRQAIRPQRALSSHSAHFAVRNTTHTCPQKGKTDMKCTACARKKVKLEPQTNLKALFASNPVDFIHHPFSPDCPTRIAANVSAPFNNGPSKLVIIEEKKMNVSQ